MKEHLVRFILRVLKKIRLLHVVNFSLVWHDGKVRLPLIKGIGFDHFFEQEEWLNVALMKWLTDHCSNKCFIDVGANIGQTLVKVKTIDRRVSYVGFEPNPNCLYYLYELLSMNQLGTATIYPVGLTERTGIMDLQLYSDSSTDSSASLVQGFRSSSVRSMKVPVFNLESLRFTDDVAAGIIKVDVEGGELDVLKGFKKLILRDRPLLICEVLPAYSEKNVARLTRQNELALFLHSMTYSIALIRDDGLLEPMNRFPIHRDISLVNYLFYPAEKHIA